MKGLTDETNQKSLIAVRLMAFSGLIIYSFFNAARENKRQLLEKGMSYSEAEKRCDIINCQFDFQLKPSDIICSADQLANDCIVYTERMNLIKKALEENSFPVIFIDCFANVILHEKDFECVRFNGNLIGAVFAELGNYWLGNTSKPTFLERYYQISHSKFAPLHLGAMCRKTYIDTFFLFKHLNSFLLNTLETEKHKIYS